MAWSDAARAAAAEARRRRASRVSKYGVADGRDKNLISRGKGWIFKATAEKRAKSLQLGNVKHVVGRMSDFKILKQSTKGIGYMVRPVRATIPKGRGKPGSFNKFGNWTSGK